MKISISKLHKRVIVRNLAVVEATVASSDIFQITVPEQLQRLEVESQLQILLSGNCSEEAIYYVLTSVATASWKNIEQ